MSFLRIYTFYNNFIRQPKPFSKVFVPKKKHNTEENKIREANIRSATGFSVPVLFKHETESAKRMKHEQKKEHSIYRRQHIFFVRSVKLSTGKKRCYLRKLRKKVGCCFFVC